MAPETSTGLSVIIPALNEENGIPRVLAELKSLLPTLNIPFEIIVVNDGSSDQTGRVLSEISDIRVLTHESPWGYGRSLADGLKHSTYPWAIIMDADGTYPIQQIKDLVAARDGADMVIGWRKRIHLPNAVLPKSFARKLLHGLAGWLTGGTIPDLNSGFRLFKKDLWEKYQAEFPSGFSFTTTLTLLAHFTRRKIVYVPIDYWPRIGTTKVSYFIDGCRVAMWMLHLTKRFSPLPLWMAGVVLTAVVLRLLGITYGFPGTVFPDEPHHINLAVYFGSGDFNPHVFKYPTLWMYVLFFAYGVQYLIWSLFFIKHSIVEFSHLFIWEPYHFYFTARLVAGLFGGIGLLFVFAAGRRLLSSSQGFWAAAFLAVSPTLVYYGHQAKPDMLLFFLCAAAWCMAARYTMTGNWGVAGLTGLFLGLAASTQYTALILVPLIVWAHFMRPANGQSISRRIFSASLGIGIIMVAVGFFIGTPYSVLDFPTFLRDFNDVRGYGDGTWTHQKNTVGLFFFILAGRMGTPPLLIGTLTLIGLVFIFRKNFRSGLFLAGPLIWAGILWSLQNRDSTIENYLIPLYPGLAIALSGLFSPTIFQKKPKLTTAIMILLLIWPFTESALIAKRFMVTDTRVKALNWIQENIPSGETLLMDQVHTGPPLKMSRTQVKRLYDHAASQKHPREAYFSLMLDSHPGKGYEIKRLYRSADELIAMGRHSKWSRVGYEFVDAEKGIDALKEAGIDYVIWSSAGATRSNSPRLIPFLNDLESKTTLVKEFRPDPISYSPTIRIYKIPN